MLTEKADFRNTYFAEADRFCLGAFSRDNTLMAALLLEHYVRYTKPYLELGFLCRRPEAPRGIGRLMLAQTLREALEPAAQVVLGVVSRNMPARQLYQKIGFQEQYGVGSASGCKEIVMTLASEKVADAIVALEMGPTCHIMEER